MRKVADSGRRGPAVALTEPEAREIAEQAVEQAGGPREIYNNPRHPYARDANRRFEINGHAVRIQIGESSSPAIVEVGQFVYEIQPEGLIKLFGPDE